MGRRSRSRSGDRKRRRSRSRSAGRPEASDADKSAAAEAWKALTGDAGGATDGGASGGGGKKDDKPGVGLAWGEGVSEEQKKIAQEYTEKREQEINRERLEAREKFREKQREAARGPSTATQRGPSSTTARGGSEATQRGFSSSTQRGGSESQARGYSASTQRNAPSMSQQRSFSKAPSQSRRNWAMAAWDTLDDKMHVDDEGRGRSYSTVRGGSESQQRDRDSSGRRREDEDDKGEGRRDRSRSRSPFLRQTKDGKQDIDFLHFLQFVDSEEAKRKEEQQPKMPELNNQIAKLGVAGAPVMRPPPKAPELQNPMAPLYEAAKLSKEELLAKIKAGRKAGGVFAERWKRFCDSNAKRRQGDEGTRDPTRHSSAFLAQALLFCQGLPMQDKLEADKEEADIEWERNREQERMKYNDFRKRLTDKTADGGTGEDGLPSRGDLLAQRPSDGVGWLRRDDGDWVFHAPRVEATCPKCKFSWKVLAEQAMRAPVVCPECGMQSWRRLSAEEQDLANVSTHRRKMKPIVQAEGLRLLGMQAAGDGPAEDWACHKCGFTNLAKYRALACMMCKQPKTEDSRRPMPGAGPVPKPKEGQSSTVALKRIPAGAGGPLGGPAGLPAIGAPPPMG
eukprot:TRINITY_DN9629_c0_g3_i1.p2 TRINITY_DN9629_c0_g3~~TRINITY_DN9629_c0_g3_i1.p2  ORF type:complete len:623 (+),score=195.13 TRINITY_DN9629_c0_g3_i1:110-1978(+)